MKCFSNKNPKKEESLMISNVFLSILIDYTQYKIDKRNMGQATFYPNRVWAPELFLGAPESFFGPRELFVKPRKLFIIPRKFFVRPRKLFMNTFLPVPYFLVFAETQAKRKVPMRMIDWIKKLDGFLELNERNILEHAERSHMKWLWKLLIGNLKNIVKLRKKKPINWSLISIKSLGS